MKLPLLLKSSSCAVALWCTAVFTLPSMQRACGQTPGGQDPAFAVGSDANGRVYGLAVRGDDQVIVGGSFTTFDGESRNCVARLHTDGSLDAFNPGLAISGYNGGTPTVQAVALQPDGKILAAGLFNVLNQAAGGGVVRLNSDGSLDSSFNVGMGVVNAGVSTGIAYALAVLPSGKILVGGSFQTFDGVSVAGLVRLNPNGSVDTTFNAGGAGIAGDDYGQAVNAITVEASGKIIIGGHFVTYDGLTANSVARLNPDGTLDTTFDAGAGPGGYSILSLAVDGSGNVYVGGNYSTFDGISSVEALLRLTSTGALDTQFYPQGDLNLTEADAVIVQPDGSILVGGVFYTTGGLVYSTVNGLVRYASDGTQDVSFDSGTNQRQVMAVALESDGKVFAASNTEQLTGAPTGNVFRYYDLVLPTFFTGQAALDNGVYYLSFANGNYFGYYSYLSDPHYIYHFDLGYEYIFDADDGLSGVYFYDFTSQDFFYTSPVFPFPYLYDFGLKSVLYYYPDPNNAGRYNTDGVRYFFDYATGKIITK